MPFYPIFSAATTVMHTLALPMFYVFSKSAAVRQDRANLATLEKLRAECSEVRARAATLRGNLGGVIAEMESRARDPRVVLFSTVLRAITRAREMAVRCATKTTPVEMLTMEGDVQWAAAKSKRGCFRLLVKTIQHISWTLDTNTDGSLVSSGALLIVDDDQLDILDESIFTIF